MPGGNRGTLTQASIALNVAGSSDNIDEYKDYFKMDIDNGYTLETSQQDEATAIANCKHLSDLRELYCYAADKDRIQRDY